MAPFLETDSRGDKWYAKYWSQLCVHRGGTLAGEVHTEREWTSAAWGRRAGRLKIVQRAVVEVLDAVYEQDFPRALIRDPSGVLPARCAGCD
jgi:hypothetical protein